MRDLFSLYARTDVHMANLFSELYENHLDEGVNLILIERDSTLNPQNMCVGQKYEVWYHF